MWCYFKGISVVLGAVAFSSATIVPDWTAPGVCCVLNLRQIRMAYPTPSPAVHTRDCTPLWNNQFQTDTHVCTVKHMCMHTHDDNLNTSYNKFTTFRLTQTQSQVLHCWSRFPCLASWWPNRNPPSSTYNKVKLFGHHWVKNMLYILKCSINNK